MSAVEIKDMLVEDACEQQRLNGVLPTPRECEVMICGVLESLDQKPKFAPSAPSQKKSGAVDSEIEKRRAKHGLSEMARVPHVVERKPIAQGGAWFEARRRLTKLERLMKDRLALLRSKPDWHEKFKVLNPYALQGYLGKEKQREADAYVRRIIESSNAIFGPWWKEQAKPLVFV